MENVPGMFGINASGSKEDKKQLFKQTITQQNNVENATTLVRSINESCFEKCVPRPGTSLSSGEQTCLTQCMQKYMTAWNAVSSAYIARIKTDPVAN